MKKMVRLINAKYLKNDKIEFTTKFELKDQNLTNKYIKEGIVSCIIENNLIKVVFKVDDMDYDELSLKFSSFVGMVEEDLDLESLPGEGCD